MPRSAHKKRQNESQIPVICLENVSAQLRPNAQLNKGWNRSKWTTETSCRESLMLLQKWVTCSEMKFNNNWSHVEQQ